MNRRKIVLVLCALVPALSWYLPGTVRAEWTRMDSGTDYELRGVWGSSATDVFAVGVGGVILFYDGNSGETWSPMQNSSS